MISFDRKGDVTMTMLLRNQARKYLNKCDEKTYDKLKEAIDGLAALQGDIQKLQGRKDEYRLKKPPYRILFAYAPGSDKIIITGIYPRGDAYKKG